MKEEKSVSEELKGEALKRAEDLLENADPDSTDAQKREAALTADALVAAAQVKAQEVIASATLLNTSSLLTTLREMQEMLSSLRDVISNESTILEARTPLFRELIAKLEHEDATLDARTVLFAEINGKLDTIIGKLNG